MKRKIFIGLILIASVFIGFTGCDLELNDDARYIMESGLISSSDCGYARGVMSTWTFPSKSKIASLRDYLYSHTLSRNYSINTDISENEIKTILIQRGMTYSEANNEMQSIKLFGADIIVGTYLSNGIWYHISKK